MLRLDAIDMRLKRMRDYSVRVAYLVEQQRVVLVNGFKKKTFRAKFLHMSILRCQPCMLARELQLRTGRGINRLKTRLVQSVHAKSARYRPTGRLPANFVVARCSICPLRVPSSRRAPERAP